MDQYEPPEAPAVPAELRAATGYACTEAPRGILYHRYRIDENGVILDATIVPPTSQNQKTIEDDFRDLVPRHLSLSPEQIRWRCEQLVRNYDLCISCSTYSLKLQIEND